MIQQLLVWMWIFQRSTMIDVELEVWNDDGEYQKTNRIGCHPFQTPPVFLQELFYSTYNDFEVVSNKGLTPTEKLWYNLVLINYLALNFKSHLENLKLDLKKDLQQELIKIGYLEKLPRHVTRQQELRLWCHPSKTHFVLDQAERRGSRHL